MPGSGGGAALLLRGAGGRGIEPQVRLPEEKVERLLDPAALSRVLGNILTNALKYSAGDLEVTLEERGG